MASRRKRKPHNLIPKEPVVHMNLRLPKSLHRSLKLAARKNHSSLHAEMLLRLTLPITRQEVADRLQRLIFEMISAKAEGGQRWHPSADEEGPAKRALDTATATYADR